MSGGGGTSTVQKSDPWVGQQGHLLQGYTAAEQNLRRNGPEFFAGNTVAGQSQNTLAGMSGTVDRAMAGGFGNAVGAEQALGSRAQGLLSGGASGLSGYDTLAATAAGQGMQGNPYQSAIVQQAVQAARPTVDSAFAASGRLGSGAYGNALADAATRTAAQIGFQNYDTERGRQLAAANTLSGMDLQAAQLGGGLTQQATGNDYQNLRAVLGVGGTEDAYQQQLINADRERWDFNQNRALNAAKEYMALIQGNVGGTTASSMQGGSPALQAIGGTAGLLGGLGTLGQGMGGLSQLGSGLGGMFGGASSGLSAANYGYGAGGYFGQGPFLG